MRVPGLSEAQRLRLQVSRLSLSWDSVLLSICTQRLSEHGPEAKQVCHEVDPKEEPRNKKGALFGA